MNVQKFSEILTNRYHVGNIDVGRIILLKRIFVKCGVRFWIMSDYFERRNRNVEVQRGEEYIDKPSNSQLPVSYFAIRLNVFR